MPGVPGARGVPGPGGVPGHGGLPGHGGGGVWSWGGDAWSRGVPGPGGLVETPPRQVLLPAVRILLECILVVLGILNLAAERVVAFENSHT